MEGAEKSGKNVRVVSMPSWELFEEQSDDYKESVLPKDVTARVSIEASPCRLFVDLPHCRTVPINNTRTSRNAHPWESTIISSA